MKTINLEQLLIFHEKIIKETGGSNGVRDIDILESALNKPFMTFGGQDLYEGLNKKISAVALGLDTAEGNYTEEDIEHWITEHQVK